MTGYFARLIILSTCIFSQIHTEEIMGVGGILMDILIPVEEQFLSKISVKKGDSGSINLEELHEILALNPQNITVKTGGSCANTIKALAKYGHSTSHYGMIGNDEMGTKFLNIIESLGVKTHYITSQTPTGIVASLITPDGERTMPAFPGASIEYSGDFIHHEMFKEAKIVHIEGYSFFNDQLVEKTAKIAKESGVLVSFDMSSSDIVRLEKETIISLLKNEIDMAFANENEAHELTGTEDLEKACQIMHSWCPCAVVLAGEKGCYVGHEGKVKLYKTTPVKPVDTTGAGDLFISGFLHGFLQGKTIEECAHLGNLMGGIIVQYMGAEIPECEWTKILNP